MSPTSTPVPPIELVIYASADGKAYEAGATIAGRVRVNKVQAWNDADAVAPHEETTRDVNVTMSGPGQIMPSNFVASFDLWYSVSIVLPTDNLPNATNTLTYKAVGISRQNTKQHEDSKSVQVQAPSDRLAITSSKAAICAGGVGSSAHQAIITATLRDADRKASANQTVTFSLINSDSDYPASLSATTATTNAQGQAVVTLTSSQLIGAWTKVQVTSGNYTAETALIAMSDAEVTWEVEPQDLMADGESGAVVKMRLTFAGIPVSGHPVTWRINQIRKIEEEGSEVVYTASPPFGSMAGYGSVSPTSGVTDSNGWVQTIYFVGTEPGEIIFETIDDVTFQRDGQAASAMMAMNGAMAPRSGSGGVSKKSYKNGQKPSNIASNLWYLSTAGPAAGVASVVGYKTSFNIGLRAQVKKAVPYTPSSNASGFAAQRVVGSGNGPHHRPLGNPITAPPTGGFTTYYYEADWDVTKMVGRYKISISGVPLNFQRTANYKIEKREQIAEAAKNWKTSPQAIPPMGPNCDDFTHYIYDSVGLSLSSDGPVSYMLGRTNTAFQDQQKGSLAFYKKAVEPFNWQHVAIYMGNGQIVDQNCKIGLHDFTIDQHGAADPNLVKPSKYAAPYYYSTDELQRLDAE